MYGAGSRHFESDVASHPEGHYGSNAGSVNDIRPGRWRQWSDWLSIASIYGLWSLFVSRICPLSNTLSDLSSYILPLHHHHTLVLSLRHITYPDAAHIESLILPNSRNVLSHWPNTLYSPLIFGILPIDRHNTLQHCMDCKSQIHLSVPRPVHRQVLYQYIVCHAVIDQFTPYSNTIYEHIIDILVVNPMMKCNLFHQNGIQRTGWVVFQHHQRTVFLLTVYGSHHMASSFPLSACGTVTAPTNFAEFLSIHCDAISTVSPLFWFFSLVCWSPVILSLSISVLLDNGTVSTQMALNVLEYMLSYWLSIGSRCHSVFMDSM